MPRGGKRPGAGRPAGRKNRLAGEGALREAFSFPPGRPSHRSRHSWSPDLAASLETLVDPEVRAAAESALSPPVFRRIQLIALACLEAHVRRGNVAAAQVILAQYPLLPAEEGSQELPVLEPEELERAWQQLWEELGVAEPMRDYLRQVIRKMLAPVAAQEPPETPAPPC